MYTSTHTSIYSGQLGAQDPHAYAHGTLKKKGVLLLDPDFFFFFF